VRHLISQTATTRSCSAKTRHHRETGPFHVFLSVPLEPEQVERIGAREGWRAKTFGRGMHGHKPFFHVIEFWLENRLMIEVVSPAMAWEYMDFLTGAQTAMMSDPESLRLMRATHLKEPVKEPA
jgi:hypothetical protein